jgi:hypothetical protein
MLTPTAAGGFRRLVSSRHFRLWLGVFVWIGVIGAVSSPVRLPTGNESETSVALLLQTIATSQTIFATSCGNGGYATSIDQLTTPPPGSSDAFFDRTALDRLARYYAVTLFASPNARAPTDCHGHPTAIVFTATAVPKVFGEIARHSFALDRQGTIWYSESPIAPTEPFDKNARRLN